jgi:poly(3-hydroxybutyrate) depolymerase
MPRGAPAPRSDFPSCAALAAAALASAAGAFAQVQTIPFGGASRQFILHAPSGLSKPPVVFVLHGSGMTGQQMVDNTRMNAVSDREKFLAVYPDAINKSWNTSASTDFGFLLAIVDTLDARYHIDRNRVYASGFSQGGVMSYHIACRYADKFAAVAPVSGRLQETCAPKRAIPMLAIFGTQDVLTPAAFLKDVATIADADGCPKTPSVTRPYPAGSPNSVVTQLRFGPCQDGVEVWADSVRGGPHEWPMNTATKINGSEEVWAFFKQWTLDGTPALSRPGAAPLARKGSVAFARGLLRWEGLDVGARLRVFDPGGRLRAEAPAEAGQIPFRAPPGVYRVLAEAAGRASVFAIVVP